MFNYYVHQWRIQALVKGGSATVLRAKKLRPRPLSDKPRPFRAFWRETSCFTCQSIRFRSRFMLRHAKVSHRSSFLHSPAREEGSIQPIISTCLVRGPAKRGVRSKPSKPPLNPPLCMCVHMCTNKCVYHCACTCCVCLSRLLD